jgi:hypothetical protein
MVAKCGDLGWAVQYTADAEGQDIPSKLCLCVNLTELAIVHHCRDDDEFEGAVLTIADESYFVSFAYDDNDGNSSFYRTLIAPNSFLLLQAGDRLHYVRDSGIQQVIWDHGKMPSVILDTGERYHVSPHDLVSIMPPEQRDELLATASGDIKNAREKRAAERAARRKQG